MTSDLHLDDHAWSDRPAIQGDSYFAFEWIVNYAVKHKLPIIAAGDLIDRKQNGSAPIDCVREQMAELESERLDFFFIQGQHELQDIPWFTAVHEHPIHIGNCRPGNYWGLGYYNMKGFDWMPMSRIEERLAVGDHVDILVMHQVCEDFMGSIITCEMSFDQIPHVNVLIIGDYHVHKQVKTKGRDGQDLLVLSPGSTSMRSIDEPSEKKFFVLYDDLTAESVTIPTRPVIVTKDYLEEEDIDKFVETIGTAIENAQVTAKKEGVPDHLIEPLIWVKYRVDIPDAYYRICNAVPKRSHLFLRELYSDVVEAEDDEDVDDDDLELVSCLPLEVSNEDQPELFEFCHRLLSAEGSPKAELASMRKEFFDEDD